MKLLSVIFLTSILFTWGCGETKTNDQQESEESTTFTTTHNAQNSLDWSGTYSGVMPCASCEGIETSITLNEDGSYSLRMTYLGEDQPNTVEENGNFSWNEAGNTITLEDQIAPNEYFVVENYLAKLDVEGNRISGDLADKYTLPKE